MSRTGYSFLAVLLAASCAPVKTASVAQTTPTPGGVAPLAAKAPVVAKLPNRGITTPLPGEPTDLAAERLVAETCAEATTSGVKEKLAAMRDAVDAAFQEWHDGQPECWAEMREEAEWAKGLSLSDAMSGATGSGAGGGVAYGRSAGVLRMAKVPSPSKSSSTNNQIANVDEADIVKTDGRYMYLAANGALRIFDAQNPKELSVTRLSGGARELFVEGDRAVVYASTGATRPECTYAYDCQVAGDGSTTQVTVFDIAKRDKPVVKRRFALSGALIAARRTGNIVHTVVADGDGGAEFASFPEDYRSCGEVEKSVRAKFANLKLDTSGRSARMRHDSRRSRRTAGSRRRCAAG